MPCVLRTPAMVLLSNLKTLRLSRIDHPWFCPQTAYLLSQGGLRRPKLTRHDMLRFYDRFLKCHLTATC